MAQTEREIICKALEIIRQALLNINNSKEEHNRPLVDDLNECILDLEGLPGE